ncbi:MAG: glycoside hydrolase family 20 zincin-like fold domain-containing protein [Sediminibacterium sp.]|nr:glycoside hydrolase family 20 zincin-like fold domain-containing protein [Sediminibacterium sp.]
MKKIFVFVVLSVSVLLLTAQDTEPIHIIPNPSSVMVGNGYLSLKRDITIRVDGEGIEHIIDQFKDRLSKATDTRSKIVQSSADIELQLSKNEDPALGTEGYRLIVTPTNITIRANKPAGLFYGMQSFFQ